MSREHDYERFGGFEYLVSSNPTVAQWWWGKYGSRRSAEGGVVNFTAFDEAVANAFIEGMQFDRGSRNNSQCRISKVRDRVVCLMKIDDFEQEFTIPCASDAHAQELAVQLRNLITVARGASPDFIEKNN